MQPRVRQRAIKAGFRSGLEQDNAAWLDELGVKYEYESKRIRYTPNVRTYTPDFVLPNGVIIETKGRFISTDRAKHLLIKEQHPDLDVRFVFSNASNRISKRSRSTYADWCNQHGFMWAEHRIPKEWTK